MRFWKYIFFFLLLVLSLELFAIVQIPDSNFHVVACNVGQGDAELLIYKNIQILVDGGPDNKVLNCLGKYLPFWDRELELVISTHPDSDHFVGLIEVLKRYRVDNYLVNKVTISKPEYRVLEKVVGSGAPRIVNPYTGQVIKVGLIYLDTLNPSEEIINKNEELKNAEEIPDNMTNEYSIVNLVSFGKFRALLTGDMPPKISDDLARNWVYGTVNYIKIPHHGSKNGLTQNLLEKIVSTNHLQHFLAVISVGKNNYGHPSDEILKMLNDLKIKYLRTDKVGDIEVVTDGETWWLKGEKVKKN